jgi:hypothetical protein
MIAIAEICSNDPRFGDGKRAVPKICPLVTAMVPGFAYVDATILGCLSTSEENSFDRETDFDTIATDFGLDVNKIRRICGSDIDGNSKFSNSFRTDGESARYDQSSLFS